MMSKNNVAFWLKCYDEIRAVALDRHSSPSSISKRDVPSRYKTMRRIELHVKGALSYPQPSIATAIPTNRLRCPREKRRHYQRLVFLRRGCRGSDNLRDRFMAVRRVAWRINTIQVLATAIGTGYAG